MSNYYLDSLLSISDLNFVGYKEANLFSQSVLHTQKSPSVKLTEVATLTCHPVLNQDICQYLSFTGDYEMPVVKPIDIPAPQGIIAFYQMKRCKGFGYTPHFFTSDYKYEYIWTHPHKALRTLKNYPQIISPDFSVYEDLLLPQKYWNIFRNKLLAAWWQYNGLCVVPNVPWIHGFDYHLSFDGWPKHSVIAINSTGVGRDDRCKAMWLEGYHVMMEMLSPKHILRYGVKIAGECEVISTYYPNDNKTIAVYGR